MLSKSSTYNNNINFFTAKNTTGMTPVISLGRTVSKHSMSLIIENASNFNLEVKIQWSWGIWDGVYAWHTLMKISTGDNAPDGNYQTILDGLPARFLRGLGTINSGSGLYSLRYLGD